MYTHAHHDQSRLATPLSELILVCDDSRVSLTGPELRGLTSEDRVATVACVSGTRHTVTWTGVPVPGLFTSAGPGDETAHLLIESADGCQVYIDVYVTLDAVVAYVRNGTPVGKEHDYEMRFIAPDVGGLRVVKGARAVETLVSDPATDLGPPEDIFKES